MKKQIYLGVDGGNTKTDFFLFNQDGERLGHLRAGSSCHEILPGGFADVEKVLRESIQRLCGECRISLRDIDYSVFGLAGADTRSQHKRLEEITAGILPGPGMVCNDAILGIMASSAECVGVCCINGTATNVCGINESGEMLQVGGLDFITSDFGGGRFLAKEVLRNVFSACCHDVEQTSLTCEVLRLLHADESADLLELFHPDQLNYDKKMELELNLLLFRCAEAGDGVARRILFSTAATLAQSTVGCIKGLGFQDKVTVCMAGSIWVKAGFPEMREFFCEEVQKKVSCECEFVLLKQPPAMGAILGAYKNLNHDMPSEAFREKVAEGIMQ